MLTGYLLCLGVAFLTMVSQLLLKWRVNEAGDLPSSTGDRVHYMLNLAIDPWILSVGVMVGIAAVLYFAALNQIELSRAVLALSTSYVGVILLSAVFFDEPLGLTKVGGLALIMAGFVLSTR